MPKESDRRLTFHDYLSGAIALVLVTIVVLGTLVVGGAIHLPFGPRLSSISPTLNNALQTFDSTIGSGITSTILPPVITSRIGDCVEQPMPSPTPAPKNTALEMLADTNPTCEHGRIVKQAISLNEQIFFTISSDSKKLLPTIWRTDGTPTGTYPLNKGFASDFIVFQGKLFFASYDDTTGSELWISDGTREGTSLLRDLNPGPESSNPMKFKVIGSHLLFSTFSNIYALGDVLWSTDGTPEGTIELAKGPVSIAGESDSKVAFLKWLPGSQQLWTTDGSLVGTEQLGESIPQLGQISEISFINDRIIVMTELSSPWSYQIWSTDSHFQHPIRLIKDISHTGVLAHIGDRIIFQVSDKDKRSLWSTNGTIEGTKILKEFPGARLMNSFTQIDQHLWFSVQQSVSEESMVDGSLWVSDGTVEGTLLVKNLHAPYKMIIPRFFTKISDKIVFIVGNHEPSSLSELWQTDGTQNGTTLIKKSSDKNFYIESIMGTIGDALLLEVYTRDYGVEPWIFRTIPSAAEPVPTEAATLQPTATITLPDTEEPTAILEPTLEPTVEPPTASPLPTIEPTVEQPTPTLEPTAEPQTPTPIRLELTLVPSTPVSSESTPTIAP